MYVVRLKVADVAHMAMPSIEHPFGSKTGKAVRFEITEQTRQAIDEYLSQRGVEPGQYLFPGRG